MKYLRVCGVPLYHLAVGWCGTETLFNEIISIYIYIKDTCNPRKTLVFLHGGDVGAFFFVKTPQN